MSKADVQHAAEYTFYSSSERWVILAAVMMGTLMQMIDSSIVNVAVPTMMGSLGATLDQISWVSTGYILASVIVLPMTGWLSSVFGRRYYLVGSMALFTVASVACGMATSLNMLVFFRIVQGIGGAALISTAQATIMQVFPPAQLGLVQGVFGLGVIIGPTIGPTLGGWIIDNFSWPWIFYINLPIGIAAIILAMLYLHDSRHAGEKRSNKIDFLGIVLLTIGLGSLQTLLEKGNKEGWFDSSLIVWLTIAAVTCITSFVIWELHTPSPVVNLRVLKHRSFAAGSIFSTVLGFGLMGGMFLLPVFMQQLLHYTAQQTGLMLMPAALAAGVLMPFIGKMTGKISPAVMTAFGLTVMTGATLYFCGMTLQFSNDQMFWPLIIRGASMGFLFVPLTMATLQDLKGNEIPEGTALFNLTRQLGGSAGIAFLSTYASNRMTYHHHALLEYVNVYNPTATLRLSYIQQYLMSKGASLETAKQQALLLIDKTIQGQAAVLAYEDAFRIMVIIFLCTFPLLFLFKSEKKGKQAPVKVEMAEM
ncbi:MAG: DHA2 family efflux MFS transporter permease subunit [bacterium]